MNMHVLLQRQLKRVFGKVPTAPEQLSLERWNALLEAVDAAYHEFDADRSILERSLELSSRELLEANAQMRAMFQAFPDVMLRLDASGTILECKAGKMADVARPLSESQGKRLQECLPEPVAVAFREWMAGSYGSADIISLEFPLARGSATQFYEARFVPLPEQQTLAIIRDITDHKGSELALRGAELRLRKQNQVLTELTRAKHLTEDDLQVAVRRITEAASQTLEVERASVWLFDEAHTSIRCVDLYQRSTHSHRAGLELKASVHPRYFQALEQHRTISAPDAATDERTSEFAAAYLKQLGITSMLDASVWLSGRLRAVVCHEHVGPARRWSLEEENFAGSMADITAITIEACERRRTERRLEAKLREVELLNRVMMGREERILELKEQIKSLRTQGYGAAQP